MNASNTKAYLFDLNGTMIDDMHYHIQAWHEILCSHGAALSLAEVKLQCYGKNDELLERIFPGRFSAAEKTAMSYAKEEAYQAAFKPQLKLLDGLGDYLEAAKMQGIRMAIGSAAIMFNIDFVLDNLHIRHYFDALVSADDVHQSKPDPETYLKCAAALQVAPQHCVVYEDSPKGVESAERAGMSSVVLLTLHEVHEFAQFEKVLCHVPDYIGLALQ